MRRKRISGQRRSPIQRLRSRLHDAEATLDAIRSGAVDAVVVSGPGGDETRAFEGATHPYHVLLNAMSDGAALLSSDGTILFGNRRLAEIARASLEDLRGSRFPQFVAPADRPSLEAFVRQRRRGGGEFAIVGTDGSATPVWIAFSPVPLDASLGDNGTAGNGGHRAHGDHHGPDRPQAGRGYTDGADTAVDLGGERGAPTDRARAARRDRAVAHHAVGGPPRHRGHHWARQSPLDGAAATRSGGTNRGRRRAVGPRPASRRPG